MSSERNTSDGCVWEMRESTWIRRMKSFPIFTRTFSLPIPSIPADQILKIAQVYDDLSPQIKNPYHANMDEMTTIVAKRN